MLTIGTHMSIAKGLDKAYCPLTKEDVLEIFEAAF